MKRVLTGVLVLGAAVGAVLVYTAAQRDREYRRLIARGESALAANQDFAAIEAFSGAIALKSSSMLAYLKRGETYRLRGDFTSALRDLRMAARLDPMATRVIERLGDVNYALGRYTRAAERYAEYARLDDRSPRVLYKLALAHYRDGRAGAAIQALRQAVALNGRFAEAHYVLGLCLSDRQRTQEALAQFKRTIELAPALIPARQALADLYRALGRTAEEVTEVEALAALEPNVAQRHVALGLAYARAGRTDLAILTLGRAAERFPDEQRVYVALGRIWLELAETHHDRIALSKALEALQGSVAANAAGSEALTLLGRALLLARDEELAERVLRQATEQLPIDPGAFTYLADAAERLKHWEDARNALILDAALVPTEDAQSSGQAARAIRIAELSLLAHDPPTAVTWFQRAADALPRDLTILGRLAEAQWRAGDSAAADATIKRGLARNPQDPVLAALQRRIK